MASDLYWVSALTYAAIILIILTNEIRIKKTPNAIEKSYRIVASWVFFFCLQDTFWGLCEVGKIKGDGVFFFASSLFHLSTVVTTFFWLYYVLTYTGGDIKYRKLFLLLDGMVVAAEFALVGINYFKTTIFTIEDGVYVTGTLRPLAFLNQYIVYFLIGIATLILSIKKRNLNKKQAERYRIVFFATLAPVMLGIFQYLFPDAPFYSLGYFLGCYLVHTFIVVIDREDAEKAGVFKSISESYYSMHLFDIVSDTVERYIEPEQMTELMGKSASAQEMLNSVVKGAVNDEYVDMLMEFVDLTTVSARMKGENHIACEFVDKFHGWMRLALVSVDKNENIQKKIMVITQIIDSEKRYQMDLMYKSNNDVLTGLFNRRAYELECENLEGKELPEKFVYVSMDVNGLKIVNDHLGHDAGDELLKGAADCMKQVYGPYGKVFRTGGDEFIALIYVSEYELKNIKKEFKSIVDKWHGNYLRKISISCGYVSAGEIPNTSLKKMAKLADSRMYEAKDQFYINNGIDRRGHNGTDTDFSVRYLNFIEQNKA